jgi:hypothetical protein
MNKYSTAGSKVSTTHFTQDFMLLWLIAGYVMSYVTLEFRLWTVASRFALSILSCSHSLQETQTGTGTETGTNIESEFGEDRSVSSTLPR